MLPPGRAGCPARNRVSSASCEQTEQGPPETAKTLEMNRLTRATFPHARPRRLRRTDALRAMVRETRLSVDNLIYPVFVVPGADVQEEIPSMPGVFHQSVDRIVEDARAVTDLGIPALLLFGLPH